MNKKLQIAFLAIALGLTACVQDKVTPELPEDLHIDASSGATNLHQLEKADFTAVGSTVKDGKDVTWYVNGKQVATGLNYAFSSNLPGEFEIMIKANGQEFKKKYGVRPRFDKGVFLLNEGSMNTETGSLTYLNAKHKVIVDNAFYRVNGKRLGNVCQDMAFANDKIYIISQNGKAHGGEGMLVIAEAKSLKFLSEYTDEKLVALNPSHIAVVGDKIYLRTDKGIYVGGEQGGFKLIPETLKASKLNMKTVGDLVFALTQDNKVLMIQGDRVVASLALAAGKVSGLALSNNGSLFMSYTNPNRIAKLSQDPKEFKILEEQDVTEASLAVDETSSSRIFAYGNTLYIPNDRVIYVHDFSSKQTSKWSDVNSEEYSTALNQYYNSLGLDDKGNVYYAALEGWGAQYKNNLTLIMDATKKTTILEKMGVNAFPAGFYTIPHKSKDKH